ncbi:hypothetical protein ACKGJO_06700 [Gracilimonas sp. Q87]|uniref:hypothetical protein n=1 Tax=Gracilimonas sp. Q87 TaxID=3384766 RepID=UPI00398433A7
MKDSKNTLSKKQKETLKNQKEARKEALQDVLEQERNLSTALKRLRNIDKDSDFDFRLSPAMRLVAEDRNIQIALNFATKGQMEKWDCEWIDKETVSLGKRRVGGFRVTGDKEKDSEKRNKIITRDVTKIAKSLELAGQDVNKAKLRKNYKSEVDSVQLERRFSLSEVLNMLEKVNKEWTKHGSKLELTIVNMKQVFGLEVLDKDIKTA